MAVDTEPGYTDTHRDNGQGTQTLTPDDQRRSEYEYRRAEYQYRNDCLIYRMIVIVLGVVTLAGMAGSFFLTVNGVQQMPDIFLALGSGAIGALAGLLAPSSSRPR